MYRVGIIGCGGIANGKHLPSIVQVEGVKLVAFCDLKIERAEKARADYGSADDKVFTDYNEMLATMNLDAVHVCTPNATHAQLTIDSLEAGCHVMCEKPMAISYAEGKRMLDTSKRTGKRLTIGYQRRFFKESQYLHKVCEQGKLGDIYFSKAIAIRRRGVPTWGVFLDQEQQGGGSLIDIGTHALDLTLWMMNNYKPKLVVGRAYHELSKMENAANPWGPWDPAKFTAEDSAFGYVVMENGATIIIESSWALNILDTNDSTTTLCGTLGGADMNHGLTINGEENSTLYEKNIEVSSQGVAFNDAVSDKPEVLECRSWYNAIKTDTDPVTLPEQALVVTQILEAIYESSKTGKAINL